jgi:hypothetical protein
MPMMMRSACIGLHLEVPDNASVSHRTVLFLRWGLFITAMVVLYARLAGYQGREYLQAAFVSAWGHLEAKVLFALVVLMVLNWTLEALKWRQLMHTLLPLSLGRALLATFAGTTVGLITPNRVGEFAGRVLYLPTEHRWKGGALTLLGSLAQFAVTMALGALAVGSARIQGSLSAVSGPAWAALVWATIAAGAAVLVLLFVPATLARLLGLVRWPARVADALDSLATVPRSVLRRVLLLSVVRYLVFTVQFIWLLHVVASVSLLDGLLLVPVIFLITTWVPTTAFTELGIRGSVITSVVPGDPAALLLVTALMWAVNLMLPALVGGAILLFVPIRTTPNGT